MRKSLTKHERVKKRSDIDRIFSSGKKVSCPGAKLFFVKNGLEDSRVLIAPVRKIGNSVTRNRVKRLGKESYRNLKHQVCSGFDLAFIMYSGDYGYEERKQQVLSLLKRAGLLCENDE